MDINIIRLLVFLIKTQGEKCPPSDYFPLNEKRLLTLSGRNKAIPFLFHFIDCRLCRGKISKKLLKKLSVYQKFFSFKSFKAVQTRNEKKMLGKYCKAKKVRAVLIKDFSPYKKMFLHHQYLMGADIDVLISEDSHKKVESFLKKNGYRLSQHVKLRNNHGSIYYQEKSFSHSKKQIAFDLHAQLTIPHQDELEFLSNKIVQNSSLEILQNSIIQKETGLFIPKKEYFLFSLIFHCLASDILKGLRSFFDIIQFAHLYDHKINWEKFLKITKRFGITNLSLFILLAGSRIFERPFPRGLKEKVKIPLRARFLAACYLPEKVALFPPINKWGNKSKKLKKMFEEHFFIKLLLVDNLPFSRLIRPRIFLFTMRIIAKLAFNKSAIIIK